MDLNTTQLFVALAELGSLSAAAQQCGIPLSTLSRKIRALEEQIQVPLFQRHKYGVTLTATGKRFYPPALAALQAFRQLENSLTSG